MQLQCTFLEQWRVAGPFVLFLLASIPGSMIPLWHIAAG